MTIRCLGADSASPTSPAIADAGAPARKLAIVYVDLLQRGDEKSSAALFASEEALSKPLVWSFLQHQDAHKNYLAIRQSFLDDIKFLRETGGGLDWSSVVVVRVREIGRHQDEIDALEIEISFGMNGEIVRSLITGPLVMDHQEWRFAGRSKAPLLFCY